MQSHPPIDIFVLWCDDLIGRTHSDTIWSIWSTISSGAHNERNVCKMHCFSFSTKFLSNRLIFGHISKNQKHYLFGKVFISSIKQIKSTNESANQTESLNKNILNVKTFISIRLLLWTLATFNPCSDAELCFWCRTFQFWWCFYCGKWSTNCKALTVTSSSLVYPFIWLADPGFWTYFSIYSTCW